MKLATTLTYLVIAYGTVFLLVWIYLDRNLQDNFNEKPKQIHGIFRRVAPRQTRGAALSRHHKKRDYNMETSTTLLEYRRNVVEKELLEKLQHENRSEQTTLPVVDPLQNLLNHNLKKIPRDVVDDERRKIRCDITLPRPNELYLITLLTIMNGHPWSAYQNFSMEDLNARDNEYLKTLENNINHRLVKQVHLFYTDEDAMNLVRLHNYPNKHKIVPVRTRRKLHMADFFLYASRNLIDKTVVAINGDIMVGRGFDLIDTERLRDEKVLYSLSRYSQQDPEKKICDPANMSLPDGYEASHDTHIFRLAEPLDEEIVFDYLDFPINMWGAENAMLWTFRFVLNFTVRNPCMVLSTYHNHCVKVHGPSKEEVKESKYSIYYLRNREWKFKHVLESFTLFEECLYYAFHGE